MQSPLAESLTHSPFELGDNDAYLSWRDKKLQNYPKSLADLVVEVKDPRQLTTAEYEALAECIRKTNFAIYVSQTADDPDPEIPLSMGRRFGLHDLDHNWLSDDSGLTSLKVASDGVRTQYIPYSNRPIKWHTDGYYNPQDRQIHGLLLHCVHSAASGGENQLMDHEIAYILMRDENPKFIETFMDPEVLTIPPRYSKDEVARPNEEGPVFSLTDKGDLHMRFTLRAHNVIWREDAITDQALSFLKSQLVEDSPYVFKGRLEPGMGLISNNVLHDRSKFDDEGDHSRHLYRARYFDRINLT